MSNTTQLIAVLLVGLAIGAGGIYAYENGYLPIGSPVNINGLNSEAGIVHADGSRVSFNTVGLTFATVSVNGHPLQMTDMIYWRFWLVLRASGSISNAQTTAVRFKLWQTLNGPSNYQAGTEHTPNATNLTPATSPTETWLLKSLPINTDVTMPLKYKDCWAGEGRVDNATNPWIYTMADPTNSSQAIREARLEQAIDFSTYPIGTHVWTLYCEVVSVAWSWTESGQPKTGTITPSPAQISYVFTVIVGSGGALSITLNSIASH